MTDDQFAGFLDVMRRHAQAQLAGDNLAWVAEEFAEFIGVARAVADTPELAVPIHAAWEEAVLRLSNFPTAAPTR